MVTFNGIQFGTTSDQHFDDLLHADMFLGDGCHVEIGHVVYITVNLFQSTLFVQVLYNGKTIVSVFGDHVLKHVSFITTRDTRFGARFDKKFNARQGSHIDCFEERCFIMGVF